MPARRPAPGKRQSVRTERIAGLDTRYSIPRARNLSTFLNGEHVHVGCWLDAYSYGDSDTRVCVRNGHATVANP